MIIVHFLQESWTQKLIDRIYNIEKKRRRSTDCDSPRLAKLGRPPKSLKQSSRYPLLKDSPPTDDMFNDSGIFFRKVF